jgi:hypothetical protein
VEAIRSGSGLTRALLVAAPLVTIGLAACGAGHPIRNVTPTTPGVGGGQKQFSAPGMAIHFRFPASFRTVMLAPSKRIAGNTGQASHAAIGVGPFDLLIVTRFPKRPIPVTASNINRLKPQFDAAVSSALGHKVVSTVGTAGGKPALSYPPAPVVGLPTPATSRITNVFVADDEYELNCQYTPKAAAMINAACAEMLSTLSVGS